MTPEDKAYYSDGNYPLFELMSQEHGLTLTEGQLFDVINCVRMMDESHRPDEDEFRLGWFERANTDNHLKIGAVLVTKMIHAKYNHSKMITELVNYLDECFEKLHKKIEMEPPSPIYIDPKSYTMPQLEQLLAIKKKQEGGE